MSNFDSKIAEILDPIQIQIKSPLPFESFERHLEPYFDKFTVEREGISERQQRIIRRFDG